MRALALILLVATFSYAQHQHGSSGKAEKKKAIWLADGLGNVDHPVSTTNREAQKYFNQGLAYLYAFNHDAGVDSFKYAAELDPDLAMAYWGIALGLGANYNDPANSERFASAYGYLQKAVALSTKATPVEQAYIAALSKRYSADPKADPMKLAADYTAAMAELVRNYPDDLDAASLYAESMMNLRPWQLWSLDGKPAPGTLEIIEVLEGVMRRDPSHTGANHYYIHAVEASPTPELGIAAANRLRTLAPNAGHLVHMPSHIYLRTGDFEESIKSNKAAIIADRNFIERAGATGAYPLMYYNHNIHMLAASYAGNGNYAEAIKSANELAANARPNVKDVPAVEMFMPYPIIVNVRFHKWTETLAYPRPSGEMLITMAHWHFARGMAFAETGRSPEAEKELAAMRESGGKFPAEAALFTNPVSAVLKVADALLRAQIAESHGERKLSIEFLRQALAEEQKINYAEPPDWDLPVREWLGRALIREGQFAEAEKVYRDEIRRSPRCGRALFGLAEALRKQGKLDSARLVEREFGRAWAGSDTRLDAEKLFKR